MDNKGRKMDNEGRNIDNKDGSTDNKGPLNSGFIQNVLFQYKDSLLLRAHSQQLNTKQIFS
jgi:hypothetical protein